MTFAISLPPQMLRQSARVCLVIGAIVGSLVIPDSKPHCISQNYTSQIVSLGINLNPNCNGNSGTAISGAVMATPWSVIKQRDRLMVGVHPQFPPFSRQDTNGQWSGFEIDLARQLALDLLGSRDKVVFLPLKPRQRLNALASGTVDLVLSQMTITTNRSRLVDFSLGYYTDGTVIIANQRQTSPPRQRIGILKGSDNIALIQQQFPDGALIGLNTYAQGWSALQANQIDYLAGDYSALLPWLQQNPTMPYTVIHKPLSRRTWGIALPRGLQHADTRHKVFQAVQTWRDNGWLDRQAKQWGVILPPAP